MVLRADIPGNKYDKVAVISGTFGLIGNTLLFLCLTLD